MRESPWTLIRGFFMGAADIVPGVSGGTVALVFGIYQRLVASIRAGSSALGRLIRLDGRGAARWLHQVEWTFLIPLLVGIGLAIVILAEVLQTLLKERPEQMSALFFGLVGGSVVVAWGLLTRRDTRTILILIGVAVVIFVALGLRGGTSSDTVGQISDPELWAFFGAGAIAICAMILPGISGSLILVILGMYGPVLGAVTDREIGTLAVFTLGAIVGLSLFSQVLHWSLKNHYDSTMAALIGLMVGSIRVLWPWPEGLESTAIGSPDESVPSAVALAVGGLLLVIAINTLAKRLERRTTADEIEELRST